MLPTADNHLQVAEEYRRLGILDAAHARLNRAFEKEPRLARAHEALARVWRDWGLPERGLAPRIVRRPTTRDRRALRTRSGRSWTRWGDSADARRAYERALSLDPTAAWALNNLCYVEFRLGRLNEARSRCEAALQLAPNLTAAHNNLALAHAAAGDLVGPARSFSRLAIRPRRNTTSESSTSRRATTPQPPSAFEQAIDARPTFTAAKARAHAARLRALTGND